MFLEGSLAIKTTFSYPITITEQVSKIALIGDAFGKSLAWPETGQSGERSAHRTGCSGKH